MRIERILNENWTFALSENEPADTAFAPVSIPHDWAVTNPLDKDMPYGESQGFYPRGQIGWYRCSFSVDSLDRFNHCMLVFDGIYECSTVWLNGVELGGHHYGYSAFRLEASNAVQPGNNTLMIKVDCTHEPPDRWYSGCGLYRTVTWIQTEEKSLDPWNTIVRSEIHDNHAKVHIVTGCDYPVRCRLIDEGNTVCEATAMQEITLNVPYPILWSAEKPHLYSLLLTVIADGTEGDEISFQIGLRSVSFSANGLLINGIPTKLKGVCLHQDGGCIGIATTKDFWRQRLMTLKEMGCNAIRAAHHMHSNEFMDLCDEMGFYVYEECFDKWHSGLYGRYFDTDWQTDVSAMLCRDRNRPSVLIWGVGNEVENQAQPSMLDTLKLLTAFVRDKDTSRPVSYAMNPHFKRPSSIDASKVKDIQAFVDNPDIYEIENPTERINCIRQIAQYVDVISCNYQEQWYELIHQALPDYPILGTELYQYFIGTQDYYQNFSQTVPALVPEKYPYVIGGFIWSGYDYLGESTGWPSRGWTGALLRTNGTKRFSYYLLKSYWTDQPMLHLAFLDYSLPVELSKEHWAVPPYESHWDLSSMQGTVIPYAIATNCDQVILLYGKHRIVCTPTIDSPNHIVQGFMPYVPGCIIAVGLKAGKEVCRQVLETPGQTIALQFETSHALNASDVMLTVKAVDAKGNVSLRADNLICFSCEGEGRILATDNGDLCDHTHSTSMSRSLFRGAASVLIRHEGPVTVVAEAEGLQRAIIQL